MTTTKPANVTLRGALAQAGQGNDMPADSLMPDDLADPLLYVLATFFSVGAAGTLCNLTVLAVLLLLPALRTHSSPFMASLAFADLNLCLMLTSPALLQLSTGSLVVSRWQCLLWTYLATWLLAASIYTVAVISLDRYFGVVQPLRRTSVMAFRGGVKVIMVVWLTAFITTSPLLVDLLADPYEGVVNLLQCHMQQPLWYVVLCDVLLFLVPLMVIQESYRRVHSVITTRSRLLALDPTPAAVTDPSMSESAPSRRPGQMRVHRGGQPFQSAPAVSIDSDPDLMPLPTKTNGDGGKKGPRLTNTLSDDTRDQPLLPTHRSLSFLAPLVETTESTSTHRMISFGRTDDLTDTDSQHQTLSSENLQKNPKAKTLKPHTTSLTRASSHTEYTKNKDKHDSLPSSCNLAMNQKEMLFLGPQKSSASILEENEESDVTASPKSMQDKVWRPSSRRSSVRQRPRWLRRVLALGWGTSREGGAWARGGLQAQLGRVERQEEPLANQSTVSGRGARSRSSFSELIVDDGPHLRANAKRYTGCLGLTKAMVTLVTILTMFVVFWLPFFMTLPICQHVSVELASGRWESGRTWCTLTMWLGLCHSAVNPLLYAGARPECRRAVLNALLCRAPLKGRKVVPTNLLSGIAPGQITDASLW